MPDGQLYLRATLALQMDQIDVDEFDAYVDYLREVDAGREIEWPDNVAPYTIAPNVLISANGGHA